LPKQLPHESHDCLVRIADRAAVMRVQSDVNELYWTNTIKFLTN